MSGAAPCGVVASNGWEILNVESGGGGGGSGSQNLGGGKTAELETVPTPTLGIRKNEGKPALEGKGKCEGRCEIMLLELYQLKAELLKRKFGAVLQTMMDDVGEDNADGLLTGVAEYACNLREELQDTLKKMSLRNL